MMVRGRIVGKLHHLVHGVRRRSFSVKIQSRIPEYSQIMDPLTTHRAWIQSAIRIS